MTNIVCRALLAVNRYIARRRPLNGFERGVVEAWAGSIMVWLSLILVAYTVTGCA